MNEEKYYLIILSCCTRNELKRKILIKGICSFIKKPLDDHNLLVNATTIIREEGYNLIWAPILDLRSYDGINIEKILEFEDLDTAQLIFEIE